MGGSASKAGSAAARAVRTAPKSGATGKSPHPAASQLSGDDDLLSKFKHKKVVEMSRPDAQAAAKKMYDQQVPDMNPDILRQAMELGPVGKAELAHQKMVPDKSELVMNKAPRPLPKDRTRAVAKSGEVDAKKGLLTQTQLQALLGRVKEPSSSQHELTKRLAEEFHVSEGHAALLLKYYRVPDIRLAGEVMTARWRWPAEDRSAVKS